jgi:hypothetical protein
MTRCRLRHNSIAQCMYVVASRSTGQPVSRTAHKTSIRRARRSHPCTCLSDCLSVCLPVCLYADIYECIDVCIRFRMTSISHQTLIYNFFPNLRWWSHRWKCMHFLPQLVCALTYLFTLLTDIAHNAWRREWFAQTSSHWVWRRRCTCDCVMHSFIDWLIDWLIAWMHTLFYLLRPP